jgi:NAD(P)-dependent dehydrogenase (short-subunit alcohol dehydrogenase family)
VTDEAAGQGTGKLAGRAALVTGAGQGIGRGIALAFAAEGADIAIVDVDGAKADDAAAEVRTRGVAGMALECDVRDRGQVDAAVAATVDAFGRLDVVVCNAIGAVRVRPLLETKLEWMQEGWEIAVLGTFHFLQASYPHLKASKGNVIGLGSAAGIGGAPGYASYGPVKEGVRTLMRTTAREWGAEGIRANTICPFAASDQQQVWMERHPEHAQAAIDSTLLGRIGDCELDIGRAAVFLASDDASYITGHTLMVDGGATQP